MKAKSIKGKTPEEIKSSLAESMANGFKPTLAIVFISIKQDIDAVSSLLDERGISIFGASSAGEFTDQGITDGAISILLLDINPAYFKIVLKAVGNQPQADIAHIVAKVGIDAFSNPAFILSASYMEIHGEAVAESFLEVVGEDVTLIGGVAGDDFAFKGGRVFTNGKFSNKGIIALIIDQDKITVKGQAVSGWKAVGTPKKITKSEGSWVYTIDDQPALDMLIKFTGAKINQDAVNDVYQKLGGIYPLQLVRVKGGTVMKPPLQYNRETKAVMCGGIVPQGSMVRFSLPPDFDVVETVIESAKKIKTKSLPKAEAMIIFSCIGRHETLGPMVETEITGLKDIWEVPLAGFFTYGEFGTPEGGHADFHGTTCSWVALKEK